jgi:hypothetical protein
MLRNLSEIRGYRLDARDGVIGECKDFLFDDMQWIARYMVAHTAKWLPGRKVLISPLSLGTPRWRERQLPVDLTKDEIKNSPPLDENAPVSRQYEMEWLRYYGHPYYWDQGSPWGIEQYLAAKQKYSEKVADIEDPQKTHLRSAKEIQGYAIHALDGDIGHVEDFIVDDSLWLVRYLVVDTRNWLPGRNVLVAPVWIDTVDWQRRSVSVLKSRRQIENSPEYHPGQPVNLLYETRLYDYYGRPVA